MTFNTVHVIPLLLRTGHNAHATTGYLKSDGTVEDREHHTKGFIKSDGTVEDRRHRTVGYLKSDGTVEDARHAATLDRVKSDGTVEDRTYTRMGRVESSGIVRDARLNILGFARSVNPSWAALVYFFFKFEEEPAAAGASGQ